MKCPNCGYEMADGTLYCEHCGEDIHIVPDFEPELEQNMEQTINGMLEQIEEDGRKKPAAQEEKSTAEKRPARKASAVRRKWMIPAGIAAAAALVLGLSGGLLYCENSLNWQVKRAIACVEKKNYEKAVSHYRRALKLDYHNIELQFSLAEVYFLQNNKVEYETVLEEISQNPEATQEQLERAYGKLIAVYRAREDYQTINRLLLDSGNETLITTYQGYLTTEPEFSLTPGYYTTIQPLRLTAKGSGKIYYTLDGSKPTAESVPYTTPIILDEGDVVVKAVFINENGISSQVATGEFHVEITEIPEPEINLYSGNYQFPMKIEVLDDTEDVYYTTDGSVPTEASSRYQEPIPLPLGKSRFQFVKIKDGITGKPVERTYQLTMNTDIMPEDAEQTAMKYALMTGRVYDEDGHFEESASRYQYEYQYVTNINQIDDFYVIDEIFCGFDGSLSKTGNQFAVNAYTGVIYKLQKQQTQESLIEIEQPTTSSIEEDSQEEE